MVAFSLLKQRIPLMKNKACFLTVHVTSLGLGPRLWSYSNISPIIIVGPKMFFLFGTIAPLSTIFAWPFVESAIRYHRALDMCLIFSSLTFGYLI